MASLMDSDTSVIVIGTMTAVPSNTERAVSAFPNLNARYFVTKCGSLDSLRRCVTTGTWASRERAFPPQPHDVLGNALKEGPVILIFSVNNCHGWHGYCRMTSQPAPSVTCRTPEFEKSVKPEESAAEVDFVGTLNSLGNDSYSVENDVSQLTKYAHAAHVNRADNDELSSVSDTPISNETKTDIATDAKNLTESDSKAANIWHFFSVEWHTEFISLFGQTCLPSSKTAQFCLLDSSPLNKARNWQEVSAEVGVQVCSLIDQMHSSLVEKRRKEEEAKLAARPAPFINMEGDLQKGPEYYWRRIVGKVERELGQVHLACPYGSQRYNVQQLDSDIDAFIVYQAHTKDILGFDPPKFTIKNSDKETCDYTVLELKRYCELLLACDARCIETLFLHDSTIIQASEEWRQLQKNRQQFLTRKCLDKYLGDALGSNGVQKLYRTLENSAVSDDQYPPPRLAKLVYIIVRLLQNSVDIVRGEPLNVYRSTGSAERSLLLRIRLEDVTVGEMKTVIQRLEEEINRRKATVRGETTSTKKDLESWLLSLRFKDIQMHPPSE